MQFVLVHEVGKHILARCRPAANGLRPIGNVGGKVAGSVGAGRSLQAAIGEIGGQCAVGIVGGIGDDEGDVVPGQQIPRGRGGKAGVAPFDGVADAGGIACSCRKPSLISEGNNYPRLSTGNGALKLFKGRAAVSKRIPE